MRIWQQKNKCTQCSYSFSHNKLKNAINVVIYFFGKQFEDSLVNAHLATIKQMHPVQLFILSDGLFEDTFKKHCQRHNRPRVLSLKLDKSFFQPKLFQIDFSQNQITLLALVVNLATTWRYLHWLQIWPPDGATCIAMHWF